MIPNQSRTTIANSGPCPGTRPGILLALALSLAAALFAPNAAAQQNNGLTTIDNPAGGQVVYGPLTNTTTLRDAMAAMLHNVHNHFGDRPQIGKFFQNKNSGSVATFFQLTDKSHANKPIAGMVIVSIADGAKEGVAAVLYDDASRFTKTQPALMQKLNDAWHRQNARQVSAARVSGASQSSESRSGRSSSGSNHRGNGPGGVFGTNEPATSSLPLHLARNGDNSGSIGLPEGWQVTGGGGGSLTAKGPHGESIAMGILNQNIYDPRTQQGASMLNYMSKGTIPHYACPYGVDLPADYLCVSNQNRQQHRMPQVSMHVLSTALSPGHPNEGALLAEMDFHDGKGVMLSSIRIGAERMGPGNWILNINEVDLPRDIADDEWSTIAGMIMTYRQNAAVINGETQTAINQINALAEANRHLADTKSKANDAHNAQVDATWDDQARQNKAFENYTLDLAVLHDNDGTGSYGRFTYPSADALVKAAPDTFQYARTQDLLKGIDY